jgi:hypothetical protein
MKKQELVSRFSLVLLLFLAACGDKAPDTHTPPLTSQVPPITELTRCDSEDAMELAVGAAGGPGAAGVLEMRGPETVQSVEGTRTCRGQVYVKQVLLGDVDYSAKVAEHFRLNEEASGAYQLMRDQGFAIQYTVSLSDNSLHVRTTTPPDASAALKEFVRLFGTREAFAQFAKKDAEIVAQAAELGNINIARSHVLIFGYDPNLKRPRKENVNFTAEMNGRPCSQVMTFNEMTQMGHLGNCIVRWVGDQAALSFEAPSSPNNLDIYLVYPNFYANVIAYPVDAKPPKKCNLTVTGIKFEELSADIQQILRNTCA